MTSRQSVQKASENNPEPTTERSIQMQRHVREPLPDGSDISKYKNYEKWSGRRWAWELLCRNDEFIEACEVREDVLTDKQKKSIAEKFGLIRFKHPSELYHINKATFVTGQISSWSNIDEKAPAKRSLPRMLKRGEVLVRFDLNAALVNRKALDSQIKHAHDRLKERLRKLIEANDAHPKALNPKMTTKINILRMIDAKRAGMKNADIAIMVFPEEVKEKDRDDAARYFKSRYRGARDLVKKGYIDIATSGH